MNFRDLSPSFRKIGTAICAVLVIAAGCTPQPAITAPAAPAAKLTNEAAGDLTLALDSLRKLRQQPRGVLDLASDGFAVLRRFFRAIKRTPHDCDDLVQIAFERYCFFCWLP